jgi:hypothetical protein
MDGSMLATVAQRARRVVQSAAAMTPAEAAVLGLLQRRLARETRKRAS